MFTDIGLVDADSIYFRAACVTREPYQLRRLIRNTCNEIRRNIACDNLVMAVKGKGNFRHDLYPLYKAHRKELDDSLKEALNVGHSYMVDYYGAVMADGMEADDLVSLWAAEQRADGNDYTVVGIDKDLLQIPGSHYNFVKREHKLVSPDEGRYNLMVQCLTGDSADNIPGIKGIGPKKAGDILHGVSTDRQWDRVRAAWRGKKAGDPALSRRLLEMLTSWEEYDELRSEIASKASIREQDVLEEGESNNQDVGVSELPAGDT